MDRRSFLSLGLGLGLVEMAASSAVQAAQVPSTAVSTLPASNLPRSRASETGFLPNVPLITHNGEHVNFYDDMVQGKTVLLNFFLVTCKEGRCPIAMANIRKVQELLGDRVGKDIFILSITLQPDFDSPKVLKSYAEGLDVGPGWTFLTGKSADIETLRRGLGFVDIDPARDRDLTNHIGMARYGNDRLDRWGSVSLRSTATNIASTFKWLSK
jgi:protein SCO1